VSATPRSSSTSRMRRLRNRRRRGVRCVTIEVGAGSGVGSIIHTLASRRLLRPEDRDSPEAVIEAILKYLHRALGIRRPS
jgi:hypothetical protein